MTLATSHQMQPTSTTARLTRDHLRAIALVAIAHRLGHSMPAAVHSVAVTPGGLAISLNSGGNALAVAAELERRGYRVIDVGGGCLHVAY